MPRSLVERRLKDVHARLKQARADLGVLDEQMSSLADSADEARIRSLVSETPLADREYHEARKHYDAIVRSRAALVSAITELEQNQDRLLDQLVPEPG